MRGDAYINVPMTTQIAPTIIDLLYVVWARKSVNMTTTMKNESVAPINFKTFTYSKIKSDCVSTKSF